VLLEPAVSLGTIETGGLVSLSLDTPGHGPSEIGKCNLVDTSIPNDVGKPLKILPPIRITIDDYSLLLRAMRFSNRATNRSNTSSADMSAGDRSLYFLRSTLIKSMVESTSISSSTTHTRMSLHEGIIAWVFMGEFFHPVSNFERNAVMTHLREQGFPNGFARARRAP